MKKNEESVCHQNFIIAMQILLLGELFYEVTVIFHCHNNHNWSIDSVVHPNELKDSPSGFRESNTMKYVQSCSVVGH